MSGNVGAEARATRAGLALIHEFAEAEAHADIPAPLPEAELPARVRMTLGGVKVTDDPSADLDRFIEKNGLYQDRFRYAWRLAARLESGDIDAEVIAYAFFAARAESIDQAPARHPLDFEDARPNVSDFKAGLSRALGDRSTLLGVAEVCAALGLKRMQLKRLRDADRFPEPVAELAAGPVWRSEDICPTS